LNGKPAFDLDDQEIQFSAEGGKVYLKTSFKLVKMMNGENLDL